MALPIAAIIAAATEGYTIFLKVAELYRQAKEAAEDGDADRANERLRAAREHYAGTREAYEAAKLARANLPDPEPDPDEPPT